MLSLSLGTMVIKPAIFMMTEDCHCPYRADDHRYAIYSQHHGHHHHPVPKCISVTRSSGKQPEALKPKLLVRYKKLHGPLHRG